MLGLQGTIQDDGWKWEQDALKPGQKIQTPEPLFAKLDEEIIEAETQRIGH